MKTRRGETTSVPAHRALCPLTPWSWILIDGLEGGDELIRLRWAQQQAVSRVCLDVDGSTRVGQVDQRALTISQAKPAGAIAGKADAPGPAHRRHISSRVEIGQANALGIDRP
jgi:hypothetical protein